MCFFHFYSSFNRKIIQENSGHPDQMAHSVASDLGLYYLPMSHKRTLGIYGLKCNYFAYFIRGAEIWEVYVEEHLI